MQIAEYNFVLVRPRETLRDFELHCAEHCVSISYRPGHENGLAIAAQAIRNAGCADGTVSITENRVGGLRQQLPSLYRLSEMPVAYGRVTAPDEFETKASSTVPTKAPKVGGMSHSIFTALSKLIVDATAWGDVPGITKGALKANGYVDVVSKAMARVTEEGKNAHATAKSLFEGLGREAAPTAPDAVEVLDTQPSAVTPDVFVTPRQREAIAIVANEPAKWMTLHGKTRNWLVNEGWVILNDGTPVLSDKGTEVGRTVGVLT